MPKTWEIGSLVWAKMKGYSPWPGRVSEPSKLQRKPQAKKNFHCIYFFGTKNYAWVEDYNIRAYEDCKTNLGVSSKNSSFRVACKEIADFIERRKEDPNLQPESIVDDTDSLFNSIKEGEGTPAQPQAEPQADAQPEQPKKSATKKSSVGTKRNSTTTPKSGSSKRTKSSPLLSDENGLDSPSTSSHITKHFEELLNRPAVERAKSPELDLSNVSEALLNKNIVASSLIFGFIGLGVMGSGIVKNLINSGHKVNLWNRTIRKAQDVQQQAEKNNPDQVSVFAAPCDVVQNSNITFCCVSDTRVAKEIVFGNCGVLQANKESLTDKGFVQLTSIDADTSKDICNEITSRGGRYLEAQLQGSKQEADEGTLIILAAGDRTLFDDCHSCFNAMGHMAFYLGGVGYAAMMNLTLQVMTGVALAGMAEGFALADRSGLSPKDVMEIFSSTPMNCKYLVEKAKVIVNTDFSNARMPLQHMQKDLKLALELADSLPQPLVMTATANEVYKHARRLGYANHDCAAIYMRTRH